LDNGVLVIGGGIAGIQSALDVADAGRKAIILESSPFIGGRMAQLDKTFPTNDCSMCILSPKLVEAGRHPNIELVTNAELIALEGEKGDFTATIRKKPRYVDEEKCVACGVCAEKCPIKLPSEYDASTSERKAIYRAYPQSVPSTYVIDRDNCTYFKTGKCRACEKFCEAKAVDFDQSEDEVRMNVASVIIAVRCGRVRPLRDTRVRVRRAPERRDEPGVRATPERVRSHAGEGPATLGREGAQEHSLRSVRRFALHRVRRRVLLLRVLHVRAQGSDRGEGA
jgi:ferredoxin